MKFLLVLPNFGEGYAYNFPLGIAYVSSALKRAGHQVSCMNLNHEPGSDVDAVARAVRELDPDAFATGTVSTFYSRVHDYFAAAKSVKPEIVTIGGGGLVSGAPGAMVRRLPMDFGVLGEGEETIVKLARCLEDRGDPQTVNGLVYLGADGAPVFTPERAPIRDLATLAWPDFEGFDVDRLVDEQTNSDNLFYEMADHPRSLPMIASRSCPFKCTFCFHPTGRIYRQRPLDDFFAELEFLIERYRINMVDILDELFAYKRDRLEEFCARIKGYGVKWWTALHVRVVEPDVIDMMRDAGCVMVSYGLENVHEAILSGMEKKSTQPMIERAMAATFGKGMAIRGNFLFGDPAETEETANYTLDWWARHRHYQISLIPLLILPGSPVYQRAVAEGRLKDDPTSIETWKANVSQLDDEVFARMTRRLYVFSTTLLLPARIVEAEWLETEGRDGRPRYALTSVCPRCGERTTVQGVGGPSIRAMSSRRACRTCGAYADIENPGWRPYHSPQARALLEQGLALRREGRHAEAMRAFQGATTAPCHPASGRYSEEAILAFHEIATLHAEAGNVREEVSGMELVLVQKPFDPRYHLAFAMSVLREGSHGAARLHVDQARILAEYKELSALLPIIDETEDLVRRLTPDNASPRYFR